MGTDCVDHAGVCRTTNACYNFGSSGKKSYCHDGIWESPDEGQTYCEACGYDWLASGSGSTSKCCGDDAGESFINPGIGNSCCYKGAVLVSGHSLGSIICYDGRIYDCNGSGAWVNKSTCDKVGNMYCNVDNIWGPKKSNNCLCADSVECQSGNCADDYDTNGGSWCEPANNCAHDGTKYAPDANAPKCKGTSNAWKCVGGAWSADNCGTSECESGFYHLKGCDVSSGAGKCFDTPKDPDMDSSYCTGCSLHWAAGGEVAAAACCGDDTGEYYLTCVDSTSNGDCGTGPGDNDACCKLSTDCVDQAGVCRTASACYAFGTAGKKSYCDGGIWQDPDNAQPYCEACGNTWLGNTSKCCGDDAGESFTNPGTGNSCCYSGSELTSGSSDSVDKSILCYNGNLYDCNGNGSVFVNKSSCDKVGSLYCTIGNKWAAKQSNSCSCTDAGDCQSGNCADDYDTNGGSWCEPANNCAHDGNKFVPDANAPDCKDTSNAWKCVGGAWAGDTCTAGCTGGTCDQ